ncbi:putative MFS-type transporter YhjX, partial [Pseudolycoriella hygida]
LYMQMAITDPCNVESQKKRNYFVDAVLWHFGTTTSLITEEQIEKERYLISNIKFNRWILLPAAFIIQFCCGSVYAWSVFNVPIDEAITGNGETSEAPITFYIAIGMLGFSAALMGPWLERNGPKKSLILSSCSFFSGNLIAALAIYIKSIWLLYLGYGVIGGFGIVGLPLTFVVLGSSYFLAMICCAFLFRIPPPGYSVADEVETKNMPEKQPEVTTLTRQPQLYQLMVE